MNNITCQTDWDSQKKSCQYFTKLTTEARDRFEGDLEFSSLGICSFQMSDIENELTVNEVRKFLSQFDIDYDRGLNLALYEKNPPDQVSFDYINEKFGDATIFSFLKGYKCIGANTCQSAATYACTGGCRTP